MSASELVINVWGCKFVFFADEAALRFLSTIRSEIIATHKSAMIAASAGTSTESLPELEADPDASEIAPEAMHAPA